MQNTIIFCAILLIMMNIKANSKETVISNYEINGIFKMLLHKNIIEYDEKGKEKKETSYVKPWGILQLGAITIYEYPEKNTKIEYFNSKETRAYRIIYKYDDNHNLINVTEYMSDKIDIPLKEWEAKYRDYYYEKKDESIYEYNDNNDLVIAKSLYGRLFLEPIENLPYEGSGKGIEEFKYAYNDKNQKISILGSKDKKTNEYLEEWKYFYDEKNNLIKKEKYIKNNLFNSYEFKYDENNLLLSEINYTISGKGVTYYYSYEYYPDGRLKRKKEHNHMDFKRIEDMKIYAYDEYTYK